MIAVDEPTISMIFGVNTSPFSGHRRQSSSLRGRSRNDSIAKCSATSPSASSQTDAPEQFKVSGRGELQLAILIEMMRREGYELQVSKPEVITKTDEKTGETLEPIELVVIDVPGGIHRRRHRSHGPPQRPDDQDDQQRLGPRASGV